MQNPLTIVPKTAFVKQKLKNPDNPFEAGVFSITMQYKTSC